MTKIQVCLLGICLTGIGASPVLSEEFVPRNIADVYVIFSDGSGSECPASGATSAQQDRWWDDGVPNGCGYLLITNDGVVEKPRKLDPPFDNGFIPHSLNF